jgi:hypothetical protein
MMSYRNFMKNVALYLPVDIGDKPCVSKLASFAKITFFERDFKWLQDGGRPLRLNINLRSNTTDEDIMSSVLTRWVNNEL